MVLSERLSNLITSFKKKLEALDQEEILIPVNVDSKRFEDELFIGSVFCGDLSGSQKISESTEYNQETK